MGGATQRCDSGQTQTASQDKTKAHNLVLPQPDSCCVRKLVAECHKLNSRLRPPLNPRERSHPRRSDMSGHPAPDCKRAQHEVLHSVLTFLIGGKIRSFSSFEDTPSIKPKATAKEPKLLAHHSLATDGTLSPYVPKAFANAAVGFFKMDRPPSLTWAVALISFSWLASQKSTPLSFASVKARSAFGLRDFQRFLAFHRLVQVLVSTNTWLPTLVLRLLQKWPDRRRASPRQQAAAPILHFTQFVVSIDVPKTPSSWARKVSSSAPSQVTSPGKSVVNLGFTTFLNLVSFSRSPIFTAA